MSPGTGGWCGCSTGRRARCSSSRTGRSYRSSPTRSNRWRRARSASARASSGEGARVRLDIFTLFPAWFGWFSEQRHVRNALELGHSLETVDLRATTPLKAGQVDDAPYGGGAGMVIRVDVVEAALAARYGAAPPPHRTVALSPGGRQFDDALAGELAAEPALTILCGRYEGFDERVHEHLATDVVSIGPYVLSGGELAAMVVADAVLRKLPGSPGHEES